MKELDEHQVAQLTGTPTEAQKAEVTRKVEDTCNTLEEKLHQEIRRPEIRYDLDGTVAGRAAARYIRINGRVLLENWEDMMEQTIPHEVAHSVVRQLWGREAKPHGGEWQYIMHLLGLPATRCHEYEVKKARNHTKYSVTCGCREHLVGARVYGKITLGHEYICRECGQQVRPT